MSGRSTRTYIHTHYTRREGKDHPSSVTRETSYTNQGRRRQRRLYWYCSPFLESASAAYSPLRRTVRSPSRTAGSHRTVHIKSTLTTTHLALFTLKVHLSPKPDHSFAWSKSTHFPYLFASNHSQSIKTKLNQNTYGLVSTHDLNRHTQLVIDRNEVLLLFYDWLFIYRLHTAAPWTIPSGISTTYYCLVAVTADAQTGSTIRYTKTRGAQVFPLMTSWVTYWPKFDQRIFLKSLPSLGILGLHWAT